MKAFLILLALAAVAITTGVLALALLFFTAPGQTFLDGFSKGFGGATAAAVSDVQDSYDLGEVEFRESGRGMVAWKARLLNNRASGILSGYVTVSAIDSSGFEVGREVVDGFNISPHQAEVLTGTVMVGKDRVAKIKATLRERWQ